MLTVKDWQKQRRAIIESREGCDCPNTIGGKLVPARERCSKQWIRCNGVLRVQYAALEKLGPKPAEATEIPTTVGGIVDMIRQTNGAEKCGATKMVGNGISFCTQPKGHDGKHGNGRKSWGKASRTAPQVTIGQEQPK